MGAPAALSVIWAARMGFLLWFLLLMAVGVMHMAETLRNGSHPPTPEGELARCLQLLLAAVEADRIDDDPDTLVLVGRCKIALRDAGHRGLIRWP